MCPSFFIGDSSTLKSSTLCNSQGKKPYRSTYPLSLKTCISRTTWLHISSSCTSLKFRMTHARNCGKPAKEDCIIGSMMKAVIDVAQDPQSLQAFHTIRTESQPLAILYHSFNALGSLPPEVCNRLANDFHYRTQSTPGRRKACARCARRNKKVFVINMHHLHSLITVFQCVLNHEGTACITCIKVNEKCLLPNAATKVRPACRASSWWGISAYSTQSSEKTTRFSMGMAHRRFHRVWY